MVHLLLLAVSSELCIAAYLRRLKDRASAQMVAQVRIAKTPLGFTYCRGNSLELLLRDRFRREQPIQLPFLIKKGFSKRNGLSFHLIEHLVHARSLIRGQAELIR